jgi:uncharacterized protein (TIGR00251 family)
MHPAANHFELMNEFDFFSIGTGPRHQLHSICKTRFKLSRNPFHIMDLSEAVEAHPLGCIIRFEVSPGASRLVVPSGFNRWRRSLEAKLTEQPTKGRANCQLMEEVAKALHVSEEDISVLSGHKSTKKVLLVNGVTVEQVISNFEQRLK